MRSILIVLLVLVACNRDPIEREIAKMSRKGDFWRVSILCADYKGEKYQSECEKSIAKAETEINAILSTHKELPFFKLMIDEEKKQKIQEVLKKNVYMGIKYRKIWNEIVERD